jgi:hypothetical protein
LNTVIVQTAANQLVPADYDVCIRDYLLPAIMTPGYVSRHSGIKRGNMHQTKNLAWVGRWDTEMACLKACAKSLGLSISDSRLYGATGVGFLINVDETAAAKSMAVWNKQGAYALCRNLGLNVESIWSHKSSKDFSTTQKLVWDRVRETIDSGYACYGFHLDDPVRSLIVGYDDCGYYYKGWGSEQGKGPVFWDDLGETDIGLLGMHFVRPGQSNPSFPEIVKRAFQFVLEFSANSKLWVPGDCKAGPDGYTRWIALFEAGREDEYGASFNPRELAEDRAFALEFLEGAKAELPSALSPLLDQAIQAYRLEAQHLTKMTQVLPHNIPSTQRAANLKDPQRRGAAITHLRAAREAEVEGLKALARIVEHL